MKYFRGTHTKPVAIYKPKITMKKIKDLTKYTASGELLDFADQVSSPEKIEVGMTAIILADNENQGGVPDGDYTMPNGDVWVFVKGTLTEMKEYEGEASETMIRALRIKNETYHWIPQKKRFMRVCTGVKLGGKLHVPGVNGKFVPAKGQRFLGIQAKISRNPGKPITGLSGNAIGI